MDWFIAHWWQVLMVLLAFAIERKVEGLEETVRDIHERLDATQIRLSEIEAKLDDRAEDD